MKENIYENEELLLEEELLSPYTHILQVSSKEFRLKIPKALNHWLRVPDEQMKEALDTVNMIHVSSLLLDDVQDGNLVRRGLPAAHCVYGLALTMNTVLHVNFLAINKAYCITPQAAKIVVEQTVNVARGQGIEVYWRDNLTCPTEDEYRKMIELKTGGMFMMAYRLMQLLSDNQTDYGKLVLLLAVYFQIRDDYCNLTVQEALEEWPENGGMIFFNNNVSQLCTINKKPSTDNHFCEDITEGKFSLPIIHALKTSHREPILHILRQRTRDILLKKYCVSLLETAGSLQYTRDFLTKLDRDIRTEICRLGGNQALESILDDLQSWKTV